MTDMNDPLGPRKQDSGEQNSGEQDRISCLPVEVLDIIIRKLPIIDAIRMTVLSENWRHNWLSLSDFHLDSRRVNEYGFHEDLSWDVVTGIINTYILHHTSSIRSFSLITKCGKLDPDMYQWMHYLSQQAVEALSIENTSRPMFKMPSYLFSFTELKSLCLTSCILQVPPSFKGLKLLNRLCLDEVSICDADLLLLILSCPLLEYLALVSISGLSHLRIHAPKLSELRVWWTDLEDIVIEAAPNLSIVKLSKVPMGVTRCLSRIDSLRLLDLSEDFMEALAKSGLALRNNAITYLTLVSMSWRLKANMLKGCLSVLSSCPNIKHFTFLAGPNRGTKGLKKFIVQNYDRYFFPELESITLVFWRHGTMNASVRFMYFIALHSPNLKYVTFQTEDNIMFDDSRVFFMDSVFAWFMGACPQASFSYQHFKQPNRVQS